MADTQSNDSLPSAQANEAVPLESSLHTKKKNIFRWDRQQLFLFFLAYSVLGWCYEVFLEVVIYGWGFSNRGFLFGPYCPVYGFGALLLLLFLLPLKEKYGKRPVTPILLFVAGGLITTGLELLTSYALEAINGEFLWNYSQYAWQFQGRIALSPSLRFAAGSLLILYVLQPLLEKGLSYLGAKKQYRLFLLSGGLFVLDFTVRMISVVLAL